MLQHLTWFRQAAFRWQDGERTIYIDPWGTPEDAAPADVILITHAHHDHFQPEEIARLSTARTRVYAPHDVAADADGECHRSRAGGTYEGAGCGSRRCRPTTRGRRRSTSTPKANRWVGYVVGLGGATYYHAGDTDHAPELSDVRSDVAMLPVGGHYTMNPTEAGGLARAIAPRLAVPMHFGFVVGAVSDGERFREAAAPVAVEMMARATRSSGPRG